MHLRRILLFASAAAVLAVVAAGAGWWFLVRDTASLATSAPAIPRDLGVTPPLAGAASALPGTTPAAATGALTFKIIPARSEAAYFADEKLASLPLPSTAKGSTNAISGEFHLLAGGSLDPAQPSNFSVDLRTLKSDKAMRDRRVQDQALDTAVYPTATFTATSVTGWDANLPSGQEQSLKLTGLLDLHGVKKQVTWDVKARHEGGVITALATVRFKFSDFNIPVLNIAGFVSVQDTVTLQVQVVAQQA